MAWRGVDYVSIVCEAGRMCVCFVMMHYSFSSGTHGKVFTKPSAEIAWLNWADVQLLRKWMLFKGANQCCTPVSVKGPSLSLSLFLHLFMLMCLKLISHILWSDVTSVPLSKNIHYYFIFLIHACMFACILYFKCKPLLFMVVLIFKLKLISELTWISTVRNMTNSSSEVHIKKEHDALQHSWGTSTSRWLWLL